MKIFETPIQGYTPTTSKKNWPTQIFIMCVGFLLCCILITFYNKLQMKQKTERLIDTIVPDNGNIITRKVQYLTFKKTDPEDTSDIFYEVVNSQNSKYETGDLIKFPHKFVNHFELEGETYTAIDPQQVQFIIKKKDVEESILRK